MEPKEIVGTPTKTPKTKKVPKSRVEYPLSKDQWDMLAELRGMYMISDAPYKIELKKIGVIQSNHYYKEKDKKFLNEQRDYFIIVQRCKNAAKTDKLS